MCVIVPPGVHREGTLRWRVWALEIYGHKKTQKLRRKELLAFCSGLLGLGFGVLGLGIGLKGLEARKRGCLYHNNKALDIELKP